MLSLLVEFRKVTQNGTQLTGEEYKSQIVKTLCQSAWRPQLAASLTSLFMYILSVLFFLHLNCVAGTNQM